VITAQESEMVNGKLSVARRCRLTAAKPQHIAVRLCLTGKTSLDRGEAEPRRVSRGKGDGKPQAYRHVRRLCRG